MKNIIKYIHIPSYPSIALYIELRKDSEVVIITSNNDVKLLCDFMGWKYIYFEYYIFTNKSKNIVNKISKILDSRRHFRESSSFLSSNIEENSEIYLSVFGVDLQGVHILFNLIKKRKDLKVISHVENTVKMKKKIEWPKPKEFLEFLKSNIMFFPPLFLYLQGGDGRYQWISEKYYMRKYNISKYIIKITNEHELYKFSGISRRLGLKNKINVFIGTYKFEYDELIWDASKVKKIYRLLKKHSIYYKAHPGVLEIDDFFIEEKQVKQFIPVEMIWDNINICVAVASLSLINLSKMGVKCICLLNLVSPKENFDADYYIELYKKHGDNILFPNDMLELENMMSA